jgi:hypothetical protein
MLISRQRTTLADRTFLRVVFIIFKKRKYIPLSVFNIVLFVMNGFGRRKVDIGILLGNLK